MEKSAGLKILFLLLLTSESLGQIPNVYEFCSALMSDGRPGSESSCQPDQCQGRPGKRGHPGIRGPPGLKGDQGIQGTCDGLLEQQARFQAEFRQKFNLIPKLLYCSLGMKSGDIPDESITASSAAGGHSAQYGRLDERVRWTSSSLTTASGAWCASSANSNQWIQVDLGDSKSVSGVVTQGRPKNQWNNQNWVKTFKIFCGESVAGLRVIMENGADKIFAGNSDKDTKVINKFSKAISCRFIRLHPLSWNTVSPWVGICLRMEILRGECFDII